MACSDQKIHAIHLAHLCRLARCEPPKLKKLQRKEELALPGKIVPASLQKQGVGNVYRERFHGVSMHHSDTPASCQNGVRDGLNSTCRGARARAQHADERQIAITFRVIESVTYDKFVRDGKSDVVGGDFLRAPALLF